MESFSFRVLLQVPEVRHIPTFAMAAEKERKAHEQFAVLSFNAVTTLYDHNTFQALQAGRYCVFRFVGTPNPPRLSNCAVRHVASVF